jgi:hypothetical protein
MEENNNTFAPGNSYYCSKFDPNGARASDGFVDMALAVAACQHKTLICGDKVIDLDDETKYPGGKVTLEVKNFTDRDQCSWMIYSKKKAPSVTVNSATPKLNVNL